MCLLRQRLAWKNKGILHISWIFIDKLSDRLIDKSK